MNDIDELVRAFRADLPEPQMPPPAETARRAAAEYERTRPARLARRIGRGLAVGAGALCAAALATVLVVLLVDQSRDGAKPETPLHDDSPTTVAPTVRWGLNATLRITPVPGTSDDAAVASLRDALTAQARAQGIAGVRVRAGGPRGLTVTVPGADDRTVGWLLTPMTTVDVVDLSAVTIATASDLSGLAAAAASLPGPITRWAVEPPAGIRSPATVTRSLSDATGLVRTWHGGQILPVPDGVLIVRRPYDRQVRLIRDAPVVAARHLRSGRFPRAEQNAPFTLELTIRPEDSGAVGDVVTRLREDRTDRPFAVILRTDGSGLATEPSFAEGRGVWALELADANRIDFQSGSIRLSGDLQTPFITTLPQFDAIVAGSVRVEDASPYGQVPLPKGDRTARLPAFLRSDPLIDRSGLLGPAKVDRATLVRTISTSTPNGSWAVYAARTTTGHEVSWVVHDRTTATSPPGPAARRDPPVRGYPGCPRPPAVQVVSFCGVDNNEHQLESLVVGRADPDVADVRIRMRGGRTITGLARNGWLAIVVPFDLLMKTEKPLVEARDARGRLLATYDLFGGHIVRP
jgi:hypothetical protein